MENQGIILSEQGNCDCKKEIFATHERYIVVPSIPANTIAYEMSNNLDSQGLDVNNAYFHLILPYLNSVQGTSTGPQLTEYFSNPQNGILFSNVVGIQTVIDFVLPSMNLNVGDVIYAINTNNLPIFFLSPTAVAELANSTYLHIYWGANSIHNNYNEKADVNVIASNSDILIGGDDKCVVIQEIKEKDTCTGEETYRYVIESNGLLVPVIDVYPDFVENDVLFSCPTEQNEVNVPNCDGTTTTQEVNSIVGAYLLNQQNKHTERLYDNVTATLTGTVITNVVGTIVSFNLSGVVATNWVSAQYLIEFGNGFVDIGANPSFDYVNEPNGTYEIKVYRMFVFPEGERWYLLTPVEITKTGSTIIVNSTNPATVNRSITYTTKEVLQDYCNSIPVGNPYLANGTSATIIGTLDLTYREELSEWLGISDANNLSGTSGLPVVIAAENSNTNRITVAQAINTTTNTNPTFTGARDVTIYNSKNVTIAFEYTTTINGTFHRVNIPANSTWSNTLKRDDYTNEGTYVLGRIITSYAATLAAGEININWTT